MKMPELHYVASLFVNYELSGSKLQEREFVNVLDYAQHAHQFLLYWQNDIRGIGYQSTTGNNLGCAAIPCCEDVEGAEAAPNVDISKFLCYSDLLQLVKANGPFKFTVVSSPENPEMNCILRVYVDGNEVEQQWLERRYFIGETYLTLMLNHALQRQILFIEHENGEHLNWSRQPAGGGVSCRPGVVGSVSEDVGGKRLRENVAAVACERVRETASVPVSNKRKRKQRECCDGSSALSVESPCVNATTGIRDFNECSVTRCLDPLVEQSLSSGVISGVRLHSSQKVMLAWMQALETKISRGEHTVICDVNIVIPNTSIVFSGEHRAFQRNELCEGTTITCPFNVGLILGKRNAGKSLVVKELVSQHTAKMNERVASVQMQTSVCSQMVRKAKGTLIVVPHSLVTQWQQYFKHDSSALYIYDKKSLKKCSRAAVEDANVIVVTHKMFLKSVVNVDPLDRIKSRLFATTIGPTPPLASSCAANNIENAPGPRLGVQLVGESVSTDGDGRQSPGGVSECGSVNTVKFELHWFQWERIVIDELLLFVLERNKSCVKKSGELAAVSTNYRAKMWWGLQGNAEKENVTVNSMFKTMYSIAMMPVYSSTLNKMFNFNRVVPACVYSGETLSEFIPSVYIDRVVFGDLTIHETQVYETLVHLKASNDYLTNVCCGDLSCMEQYMTTVGSWMETIPKGIEALNQCLILPDSNTENENGNDSDSYESDSEYSNEASTGVSDGVVLDRTTVPARVIETRSVVDHFGSGVPVLPISAGLGSAVAARDSTVEIVSVDSNRRFHRSGGLARHQPEDSTGTYLRTRSHNASVNERVTSVTSLQGVIEASGVTPVVVDDNGSASPTESRVNESMENDSGSSQPSPATSALDKLISEHSSEIAERREYFLKTTGQLATGEAKPAVCAVCLVNLCDCIFVCGHMLCHQCIIDLFESTAEQDDEYQDFMAPCPTCRWNVEPHEVFWVLQTAVQPPHKFQRLKQIVDSTKGSTVVFGTHPEILHQMYKLLISSLSQGSVNGRIRKSVGVQPVSPNGKMCKHNMLWYKDPASDAVGVSSLQTKKARAEKPKVLFIPYSKTFGLKIHNVASVIFLHSFAGSRLQQRSVEDQALQCIMPSKDELLNVFRLRSLNTVEK
jgi:hypothetical protein